MSYKLAVASSSGTDVALSFGAAGAFRIYEVDGLAFRLLEERDVPGSRDASTPESARSHPGCGGGGGCCGGKDAKIDLLSDVRAVIATKFGGNVQRQLERKAISSFAVSTTVTEVLTRIAGYYDRVDRHQSLRGIANK